MSLSNVQTNIDLAKQYIAAIERGAVGTELAKFFHPTVEQIEYPNRLVPKGAVRKLDDLLAGAEKGNRVVARQSYVIRNIIAQGDSVVLEVDWTATLKLPVGLTPVGGNMMANFAVVLRFADGRIISQHNYDCFHEF